MDKSCATYSGTTNAAPGQSNGQVVVFVVSLFIAQDLSFCNDKNVILLSFVNVKELLR